MRFLSKADYKLIAFNLFVFAAIILSIYFFIGLRNEKRISQIDLFSLIPLKNTTAVLQINDVGNFALSGNKVHSKSSLDKKKFGWLNVLDTIVFPFSKNVASSPLFSNTNPLYISFHENGEVYYAKLQQQKMNLWKKYLNKVLFPDFPPVIQQYKGFEIKHYVTSDSRFFSCVMHDGVFVGSFKSKILQHVIDTWLGGESIKEDPDIKQLLRHDGKNTVANLFYHLDAPENIFVVDASEKQNTRRFSGWSNADITFENDNEIWFSGYFKQHTDNTTNISDYLPTDLFFPKALMPPQTLFVKGVSTKKAVSDADSLLFKSSSDGLYTVYLNDSTAGSILKMYCLKLDDQTAFEKELNSFLENRYLFYSQINTMSIDTDIFNIFELHNGNILNEIINCSFFTPENAYYLVFYKGFLFISDNERDLNAYLTLLLNPNWTKYISPKENKKDLSNIRMTGNVKQIVEADSPILYLSENTGTYLTPFSQWNIDMQYMPGEDLFLFHLLFAKEIKR